MVDGGPIDSTHPARRITRLAESIKPPGRHRVRMTSSPDPATPALVPGRGLFRRHPRSPLSSLLRWALYLLVGAAIIMLALRLLLS